MSIDRTVTLELTLIANGYTDLRVVGGAMCGLLPFIFTTGLMVGLDAWGYSHRYCYEHRADALAALQAWDGAGDPSGPWIKLKGLGADERLGPGALS